MKTSSSAWGASEPVPKGSRRLRMEALSAFCKMDSCRLRHCGRQVIADSINQLARIVRRTDSTRLLVISSRFGGSETRAGSDCATRAAQ